MNYERRGQSFFLLFSTLLLFSSLLFSFSLFFSAILLFFIMPIQGVDILKGKSTHSQGVLLTEICLLSFFFYIL